MTNKTDALYFYLLIYFCLLKFIRVGKINRIKFFRNICWSAESIICAEKSRNEKKPLWEGDETLCADGQSCEFFLKCWMSAGLLDGSCGGIMFACCQRKDAKASGDLNLLVDTPRDQLHPQLTLDSYTETANDERKFAN